MRIPEVLLRVDEDGVLVFRQRALMEVNRLKVDILYC